MFYLSVFIHTFDKHRLKLKVFFSELIDGIQIIANYSLELFLAVVLKI